MNFKATDNRYAVLARLGYDDGKNRRRIRQGAINAVASQTGNQEAADRAYRFGYDKGKYYS